MLVLVITVPTEGMAHRELAPEAVLVGVRYLVLAALEGLHPELVWSGLVLVLAVAVHTERAVLVLAQPVLLGLLLLRSFTDEGFNLSL